MAALSAPLSTGRISPSTKNYMVGKGFLIFKEDTDTSYYHLGNVSAMQISPKTTLLDHFSSQEGIKLKDLSIITETSMEVKVTMEEITARNLGLFFVGDVDYTTPRQPIVSIMSKGQITGHLKFFAANAVGPRWYIDLPSVTFNPTGSFDPISDAIANMEVTASVNSQTAGDFGTMQLHPAVGSIVPECLFNPFIDDASEAFEAEVGETLVSYVGGWIGVLSFSYQWNGDGTPIYGATDSTYVPVIGDIGKVITVTVTGTNLKGSTAVTSAATPAVIAAD